MLVCLFKLSVPWTNCLPTHRCCLNCSLQPEHSRRRDGGILTSSSLLGYCFHRAGEHFRASRVHCILTNTSACGHVMPTHKIIGMVHKIHGHVGDVLARGSALKAFRHCSDTFVTFRP